MGIERPRGTLTCKLKYIFSDRYQKNPEKKKENKSKI
ncbi:hypothetical protein MUK42_33199 [Musa troglodytarum]|uniref:Uncharacterized protein n=1 Tax=Musa troglodytarum TaxID=320322 RepID=A0A9E7F484_9LILI|nr:hypothetical protein MUK42_33199 [Musa troglodytarum]